MVAFEESAGVRREGTGGLKVVGGDSCPA